MTTNDSIILNGVCYTLETAKTKQKDPTLPPWETDIFTFVVEWFNPSKEIEVSTSGSTGKPKTIRYQKKHMRQSAQLTGEFFAFTPNASAMLCLPATFIAGKMMIVRAIEWQLQLDYISPKIKLLFPPICPLLFLSHDPSTGSRKSRSNC